jgi:hypothetical protein
MDELVKNQICWNSKSTGKWNLYSSHREHLTRLIKSKALSHNDRLCILGAGNCNDLDLNVLVSDFRAIHLVDIDYQAMRNGLLRQGLGDSRNIFMHGGIDLSGCFQFLSKFDQNLKPSLHEVTEFIQAKDISLGIGTSEPFEVVISACLLTQLISTVINTLGNDHPQLFDFILKVRNHHLHQLLYLTKPHGWCLLATDIVSSDSAIEIMNCPEEDLLGLINHLIAHRNFFHGVNPYIISSIFSSSEFSSQVQMLNPWCWDFGPRVYAVCAIEAQRNMKEIKCHLSDAIKTDGE